MPSEVLHQRSASVLEPVGHSSFSLMVRLHFLIYELLFLCKHMLNICIHISESFAES